MAGIKIADLPNITLPYTGTEKIPITQDGDTRNGTLNSVANYLSSVNPLTQDAVEAVITNKSEFREAIGAYNYFNVVDFGAVGDGVTDDAPAIQDAIDAALLNNSGVFFPPGIYQLESDPKATSMPYFQGFHLVQFGGYNIDFPRRCDMIGYGEVILRSNRSEGSILHIIGNNVDSIISGISFQNTYSGGLFGKSAIYAVGTAGQLIRNLQIQNNVFDGFSVALVINGVTNAQIKDNCFLASKGRDGGSSTNQQPNVFIWFFSNENGKAINPIIQGNSFNGYSGNKGITVDAPVTKTCMDGAIYGSMEGAIISNNTCRNMMFEQIAVASWTLPISARNEKPTIISNNSIDCSVPNGALGLGGGPVNYGWGIRVDSSYVTITNNTILNSIEAILCRTSESIQRQVDISNNFIVTSKTIQPGFSIAITSEGDGNTTRSQNCSIRNNSVLCQYLSAFTVANPVIIMARCDDSEIVGNRVSFVNFTSNALLSLKQYAIQIQESTKIRCDANYMYGGDYFLQVGGVNTNITLTRNQWDNLSGFSPLSSYAGFKIYSDLNGVTTPADIEVTDSSKGVILKSANSTRWRITVSNSGTISATTV